LSVVWLERGSADSRHAGRTRGDPIRLIGVGVSGFGEGLQLGLFADKDRDEKLALAKTLDELQQQYGKKIVRRASLTDRKR
jgi:hypothetical protein